MNKPSALQFWGAFIYSPHCILIYLLTFIERDILGDRCRLNLQPAGGAEALVASPLRYHIDLLASLLDTVLGYSQLTNRHTVSLTKSQRTRHHQPDKNSPSP